MFTQNVLKNVKLINVFHFIHIENVDVKSIDSSLHPEYKTKLLN